MFLMMTELLRKDLLFSMIYWTARDMYNAVRCSLIKYFT